MDNNKIGNFIATLRKEKGLTQQELGEKLFVTDKAVSKWERGLSLPDIGLLESLAQQLDVDVTEILKGEKGKDKNINIQEEIDKSLKNIKKEQIRKIKKYCIISSITLIILGLLLFFITSYYKKYHPNKIIIGDNNYSLGFYNLEQKGLSKLEEMVKISKNSTKNYNITYFEAKLNKNGIVKSFTLSINFFDNNLNYVGSGGYTYKDKKLSYTYTGKEDEKSLLVDYYSKNDDIKYISEQIKKIPLKKQLKISELNNYVISYKPNTSLKSGTPIFDGKNNKKINSLTKKDYNNKKGGESSNDIYFVIRLNDGSSNVIGQQYLYVFDYIDKSIPKNPEYMMETDYKISNNELKFTRDYGKTWINTDINKEQVSETLDFYKDNNLIPNSFFLSTNNMVPIAYFYGEEPKLKISNNNGESWTEHKFITSDDIYGKQITKRVVGFSNENFGYVALGTDWTMGSGEVKKLYFTYDGGKKWSEVNIPENGTSHILYDVCMYDENVGIIIIRDSIDSNFPIIYSTTSGGKAWNKVSYQNSNLPDEITYLYDVDSIKKEGEEYYITLGQGNSGTLKVTFRAVDMMNFLYINKTNSNIHTSG